MPDMNEELDDEQQGSATGTPHQAKFDPGQQQQYVPWSSFESANRDVATREAKKLQGNVQGDVSKAAGELSNAEQGFDAGLESNYGRSAGAQSSSTPAGKGEIGAAHLAATPDAPAQLAKPEQPQRPAASNPWATLSAGVAGQDVGPLSQLGGPIPNAVQAPSGGFGGAPPTDQAQRAPGSSSPAPSPQPPAPVSSSQAATASQADEGNPWASFLGPAARHDTAKPPPGPAAPPGTQSLNTAPLNLAPDAAAGNPTGAHDLEGAAGQQAWSSLLGDTLKANQEAHALGSEAGVQSLLQHAQTSPMENTAFDAALLNSEGQKDFSQLDQQYGRGQLMKNVVDAEKGSQDRWKQLQGDVKAREAMDRPGGQTADLAPQAPTAQAGAHDPSLTEPTQDASLHELLYGKDGTDFFSLMHQAGLSLSPADWGSIAIGENGTDSPMPTEAYVTAVAGSIANGTQINKSWPQGKFQMAWGMVAHEYPPAAMKSLLDHLAKNPADMKRFLSMQNPGFMARNLRMWLSDQGFQKGDVANAGQSNWSQSGGAEGVQGAGATKGETWSTVNGQQQSTTDEQETARTQAYRDGWGEEWDKQFREGNPNPSQGG